MSKFKVRLSKNEQIVFLRQLGMLLQGGVSLLASLKTIEKHTTRKQALLMIQYLASEVEQGRQLSRVLGLWPRAFGSSVVNQIELGEMSGMLPNNLISAANELRQGQIIQKKIIASLIYPAIIVAATGGVVALLVLYVFPKVLPVFESVHMKLPLTTRLLIFSNAQIRQHGEYIALGLLSIALAAGLAFKHKSLKKALKKIIDRRLINLPLIGPVVKNYFLARFCRTFGQLLQQGVPVTKAAMITASATKHSFYKQRVIALSLAINHGQNISQFFANEPALFPAMLCQLVSVGEQTGTLSENLLFLAQLYEQEIENTMERVSVIMEPLMMIVIGALVGFVAISIITPIYQITQNIHG